MKNDLTVGNVYQKMICFTLPILVGNLLWQFYNIADSAIVGRALGSDALAAVGASWQITNIMLAVAMGLTLGMGILLSTAYGGEKKEELQKIVDTGLIVAMVSALFFMIAGIGFAEKILLLYHVPEQLMRQAASYFRIVCVGMFPLFLYNTIAGYLRGIGDAKAELLFLIISAFLNIGMDILFVMVLALGVEGAALATVLSQTVAFVLICGYVQRSIMLFHIQFQNLAIDKEILKRGLCMGIPATMQQLFVGVGNSVIQSMINGYGTTVIAAYTAASRIDGLAVLPAVNIGKAMSNFIAQNKGANDKKRIKEGIRAGIVMVLSVSVFFSTLLFIASDALLGVFGCEGAVRIEGVRYLRIIGAFFLFFGVMHCLNGVLLGVGKSNLAFIGSVLSFCIFQVPLAIVLSHIFGVVGIWFATPIGWIAGMLVRIAFLKKEKL